MSNEIKTEKMFIRVMAEDKALLNEAASIGNTTLSDFVRSSAVREARHVIAGEMMAICPEAENK